MTLVYHRVCLVLKEAFKVIFFGISAFWKRVVNSCHSLSHQLQVRLISLLTIFQNTYLSVRTKLLLSVNEYRTFFRTLSLTLSAQTRNFCHSLVLRVYSAVPSKDTRKAAVSIMFQRLREIYNFISWFVKRTVLIVYLLLCTVIKIIFYCIVPFLCIIQYFYTVIPKMYGRYPNSYLEVWFHIFLDMFGLDTYKKPQMPVSLSDINERNVQMIKPYRTGGNQKSILRTQHSDTNRRHVRFIDEEEYGRDFQRLRNDRDFIDQRLNQNQGQNRQDRNDRGQNRGHNNRNMFPNPHMVRDEPAHVSYVPEELNGPKKPRFKSFLE